MKRTHSYIIVVFIVLLLNPSCRQGGKINQDTLIVKEIISGNRIKTSNGKVYGLIGVSDKNSFEGVLESELLDQAITYRYDKRYNSFSSEIFVYVNRKHDGMPINKLLLSQKEADLDTRYLSDSLKLYKSILGSGSLLAVDASLGRSTPSQKSLKKPKNVKEMIKRSEKGVFLVLTKDRWGNVLGTGTGFFINDQGVAVSNHHVFDKGSTWDAKLKNERVYEVTEILHESPGNDFIIFKVGAPSSQISIIPLGSGTVDKGEEILVLGNPKGLERTLTRGIVSSPSRMYDGMDLIQMDAAISPGSSGSPVMQEDGAAIGVATLKFIDCENCNFAVNIDDVKRVLNSKGIDYYEY